MAKSLKLLLALGAIVSAVPAGAADFTFNVPVRVDNMNNATQGWVSCDIYQGTGASRRSVGFGRTDIAIRSGAYAGNVSVTVNAASGFAATDADSWGCFLTYVWNMPDGSTFLRSTYTGDERNSLYTRYTGQEVASSHTEDGGAISR